MAIDLHAGGINDEGTFDPAQLFASEHGWPPVARKVVIPAGAGTLAAGTVLGKVTIGALTAAGAAGTPAPVGATITSTPTAAAGTQPGVHIFQCIVGGAGTASKWRHIGPTGEVLGVATGNTEYVGTGAGALTLTITDAGTDPGVGETFAVTVTAAAGSGKFKTSLAAAKDGSQTPTAILAHPVTAGGADVEAMAYFTGHYRSAALTFGTGHTAASTTDGLHVLRIHLD